MRSLLLLIIFSFLMSSCKTYQISTDSLKKQFAGIDSTDFKQVHVKTPWGVTQSYLANPIEEIKCVNKNGNVVEILSSPSIEIKVTEKSNQKTIFYFDRIYLDDSILYGVRSRFAPFVDKTIPLENIKKIEVQDGKKNFSYIKS